MKILFYLIINIWKQQNEDFEENMEDLYSFQSKEGMSLRNQSLKEIQKVK